MVLLVYAGRSAGASTSAGKYVQPSFASHVIEALAADSTLIVTARLTSFDRRPDEWHGMFVTGDVLKSPAGFVLPAQFEAVLTFETTRDKYVAADAKRLRFPPVDVRVLLFLRADPLASGVIYLNDYVVLDESGNVRSLMAESVYDLTLKPVTDSQRVMAIVQAELLRVPPTTGVRGSFAYPLSPNTLPDDDRLIPLARQWVKSENPLARLLAVSILLTHPDPQDEEVLKGLLNDPYVGDYPWGLSPWSGREYAIRFWAWRALSNLGVAVAPQMAELPQPGLYRNVSWLWLGVWVVLPVALYAGFRRMRRRRTGLGRPTFMGAAASYLTFVCLGLAVLMAASWKRSMHTADDFVYARYGFMLDITSIQENVYFEWGRPWPLETSLVHAAITPDPIDPSPINGDSSFRNGYGTHDVDNWHSLWEVYIQDRREVSWMFDGSLSYELDTRPFDPSAGFSSCRGVIFAVAYPYLIGMLLVFPAIQLLLALVGLWRKASKIRKGLCVKCAYDLRAHTPGDRCPECGEIVPVRPLKGAIEGVNETAA